MPSSRAILIDIEKHNLNPNKFHNAKTLSKGKIGTDSADVEQIEVAPVIPPAQGSLSFDDEMTDDNKVIDPPPADTELALESSTMDSMVDSVNVESKDSSDSESSKKSGKKSSKKMSVID